MKRWNDLSMKDRQQHIRAAIKNGITDLQSIRDNYNEFAEGGDINKDKKDVNLNWLALDLVPHHVVADSNWVDKEGKPNYIETFVPNQLSKLWPGIDTTKGYYANNPFPGENTVLYNPNDKSVDENTIILDGLHYMHDNPRFQSHLDTIYENLKSNPEILFHALNDQVWDETKARELTTKVLKNKKLSSDDLEIINPAVDGFLRNQYAPDYMRTNAWKEATNSNGYGQKEKVDANTEAEIIKLQQFLEQNPISRTNSWKQFEKENMSAAGGNPKIKSYAGGGDTESPFVEWWKELFGSEIRPQGRGSIKVNKDEYGNYTFNGRPPAEGYTYYDRTTGNTYKFINGKRTLVKQNLIQKRELQKKQQAANDNIHRNIQQDQKIANVLNYGIKDSETVGGWNTDRLYNNISPRRAIHPLDVIKAAPSYIFNFDTEDTRKHGSTGDESMFRRHLGRARDLSEMPINGIRFSGDYNNNGSYKYKNAEYTGIPAYAKRAIIDDIQKQIIAVDPNGKWSPREETLRNENSKLTQYGNFSIRENNDSGIYDIFDTYDFPKNNWWFPNLNRQDGKQIEVRDTIWGPNAIPELYDPTFNTEKASKNTRYSQ